MLDTKDVDDSEEDRTVAYQTFVPELEDSLYSDSGEEMGGRRNGRRFAIRRKLGLVCRF
jgi:hypothetical protein